MQRASKRELLASLQLHRLAPVVLKLHPKVLLIATMLAFAAWIFAVAGGGSFFILGEV